MKCKYNFNDICRISHLKINKPHCNSCCSFELAKDNEALNRYFNCKICKRVLPIDKLYYNDDTGVCVNCSKFYKRRKIK